MKYKELSKEEQRWVRVILIGTILLAVLLLVLDHLPADRTLMRNTYGKGDKKEELLVTIGDQVKKEPITVEIGERTYTRVQLKKVFDQCSKELDSLILGKNQSLDEVRSNLNLITMMPDRPVEVVWEIDNYEVINVRGELVTANLTEQGTLVELKATLTCQDEKMQYITNAKLYPPKKTKAQKVIHQLKQEIHKSSQKTSTSKTYTLPDAVSNHPVVWSRKSAHRSLLVLLLGGILCGLVVGKHMQDEKEAQEKRQRQLMIDYPEIVNRLMLLIGAGMTVKSSWRKIVSDYAEQEEERYAYEEMAYTLREMQSGVAEAESYERFGERCGLQAYLKLGALLSQNLRKGTKGLTELLSMKAIQAFEERKALAKRLGEEASTKLLMPMFLMLAVVLVIVIVPAFLSMQM